MRNLIKKLLSNRTGQKLIGLAYKIWCLLCKLLPMKNRTLFFTIRADGKETYLFEEDGKWFMEVPVQSSF